MAFRKEDYWIRPRKKLLEYQIGVFKREINRIEKQYEKWISNMPNRMEKFKPKYQSREEIDEAYLSGLITAAEYTDQKNRYRIVYNDYGSKMKLAWLYSQLEQYQSQYEALMEHIDGLRKNKIKKIVILNRRRRKELKRAEQKAREEACKYWKHIYDDVDGE